MYVHGNLPGQTSISGGSASRKTPRVAFFPDSFEEVNGVALTSREFARFARACYYPFLCVHAGWRTGHLRRGSYEAFALARSRAVLHLEHDLFFDLLFLRHRKKVRKILEAFRPDLVHITGPGHIGMLGAMLAHDLGIPLVASWHTNVHEFGSRRLLKLLERWPEGWRNAIASSAERFALDLTIWFYRHARMGFAPNPELLEMLQSRTHRPVFPMPRGIDTALFSPARRVRADSAFLIGCVGRLSAEKNVRFLAALDRMLRDRGVHTHRFLVVGEGSERAWLREHLSNVELPGMLRGEALASAYASMDVFVFPSETDTFGNVALEAMASGVPVVVSSRGGPKYLVDEGVDGFVASSASQFADAVLALHDDPALRLRMASAARESSLSRSWDAVFEGVYERYREGFRNRTLLRREPEDYSRISFKTRPAEPLGVSTPRSTESVGATSLMATRSR